MPASPAPTVDWPSVNQEAVQKLSEFLQADTSNPPGTESDGVAWLEKVFRAEGIPFEMAESAPGRGNIVARLKGSGRAPALVLLSHIDVVPVNREYWTVEPFGGIVNGGYVWGRGAVDMKGQGIAQLMAFLLLHRTRVPLERDVIYLATADEEAGGDFGARWVAENRPKWIEGAGFLLNEGAMSLADEKGIPKFFGVGPTEKTPAWLKLSATGTPGHGSVPKADSSVNRMIAALERLRNYQPPLEVTPPVERALQSIAAYETEPWRSRFRDIRAYVARPEARTELAKRPAVLALLQNTVSITGLEGTKKINIIPPVATALVDCRLLPGWTVERWVANVKRVLNDDAIQVEVVLNFPPTESSVDSPLYRSIEQAVQKLHPRAGLTLSITTGFTDSHFFRERGIVSYGFVPFALTDEDGSRAHGNDERIPVKSFTDGTQLMWEVVLDFARAK